MMEEITVQQFKHKIDTIDTDEEVFLLDVREPFERYQSAIDYENSTLIPVDELPGRLDEIKEHKKMRSFVCAAAGAEAPKPQKFLGKKGFENVKNLKGGINQWAREIDNNLPVY